MEKNLVECRSISRISKRPAKLHCPKERNCVEFDQRLLLDVGQNVAGCNAAYDTPKINRM